MNLKPLTSKDSKSPKNSIFEGIVEPSPFNDIEVVFFAYLFPRIIIKIILPSFSLKHEGRGGLKEIVIKINSTIIFE